MKNSHKILVSFTLAAVTMAATTTANAANKRLPTERFKEYAKVLEARPVYQDIRIRAPEQQCWMESERYVVSQETNRRQQRTSRNIDNNVGNSIIGGLIGGVIGNQLGRGHSAHSRAGATVAGAIIGSAIGNETNTQQVRNGRHRATEQQSSPVYEIREVQRCKEVIETRTERQLQHYNVTYLYRGRKFITQLPRNPGKQIELQVSVAPARR